MSQTFKKFILFLGDILIFYLSLILTLALFYHLKNFGDHFLPFTILLIIWLIVFYLAEIYNPFYFFNLQKFAINYFSGFLINIFLGITFFYLFSSITKITPKTNYLFFAIIFAILSFVWHFFFIKNYQEKKIKTLFIKTNKSKEELDKMYFNYNCYSISEPEEIKNYLTTKEKRQMIIVLPQNFEEKKFLEEIIKNLTDFIEVKTIDKFEEEILKKIPLEKVNEKWILENIAKRNDYLRIRYFIEKPIAFILLILLLPLFIVILILIKITSKGPIFYKQIRVGKDGKIFEIYKFRSMIKNAEMNGPQWAQDKDSRVTKIGKILRHTHLDELPQLLNVLRGEISFVGPRPERPEFVEELRKHISFYDIRHLIKPGITGWAQINYPYGNSIVDSKIKFEYDLYYLKNFSLFLDFLISLKTIKRFFTKAKKIQNF